VEVATGFMRQVEFDCNRMNQACQSGFMNAMDAAIYLVGRGVPFRQAHEIVAHAVQRCMEKHCEIQDLSLEELQQFSPAFASDVYDHLTLEAVIAGHDVHGGTAPKRVDEALHQARQKLAAMQEAHGTYA
jgi:argininosuccinate lyase